MNSLRQLIRERKTEEFIKVSEQYDIYSCDAKGNTLLHDAAQYNAKEITLFLIKMKLNVNLCNYKYITPLHMAAMSENTETALVLLQNGAKPNQRTSNGVTALHYAAQHSDAVLAADLIQKGANLQAATFLGQTPYNLANMESGNMINSILQKKNIFNGNIVVTEEDSNKEYARPDFSDIGLIAFNPELVSNPNPAKRKTIDGYFNAHFHDQPVQLRVVCLPRLNDQNKELLLTSITETRAFQTPVINPSIGIIMMNDWNYGIMTFSSEDLCIQDLIENEPDSLSSCNKIKICEDVLSGLHYLLLKTSQMFANIFLDPTTVTYNFQSGSAKIDVFSQIYFDVNAGNCHYPEFTAPEVLVSMAGTNTIPNGEKKDPQYSLTYSLGAILMYMFLNGSSFKNINEFQIGQKIARSYYTEVSPYKDIFVNEDVNRLVKVLLLPNPVGRKIRSSSKEEKEVKFSRPFVWQLNNVGIFKILNVKVREDENFLALKQAFITRKSSDPNGNIEDAPTMRISTLNKDFQDSLSVQNPKRVSLTSPSEPDQSNEDSRSNRLSKQSQSENQEEVVNRFQSNSVVESDTRSSKNSSIEPEKKFSEDSDDSSDSSEDLQ